MRRLMALVTVIALVHSVSGCRHIAGACDCEHAINPSYTAGNRTDRNCGNGTCNSGKVAQPQPVSYEQSGR